MSGWEHRPPSEVQMGNGTLLATFDSSGEIEQLFAPNIDALQSRIGAFRTSVLIPSTQGGAKVPEMIRVSGESFHIRLQLEAGSQVLAAEYHHKSRPIKISRKLALHPTEPILLDRWIISDERAGLIHESIPWMGHSTSSHCSMFHPTFNGMVHHRGRRWLGILLRGQTPWVRVGHLSDHDRYRLCAGERISAPVFAGDLAGYPAGPVRAGWDQVVQGPGTWGAIATVPKAEIEFLVICAESEKHLGRLTDLMRHIPTTRFLQMIEGMVERRHAPAASTLARVGNPRVRALCERSIDVLHALQDARSGALMAAAEVDPHSKLSGGYGFSWPRDGAYLAAALGAFGFRDRVEHYFRFLEETQDVSGAWWQRYLATGHAGPSWGRIQIDEPATVIGAASQHFRRTGDLFWLEKIWPTLKRGLDFLEAFHSEPHPMGLPSHDLWEERMGVHAYSLAAVSAAFLSGASLARELSDRVAQRHYHRLARESRRLLIERFTPVDGPIRRAFIANYWDLQHGGGYWDEVPDVSMLGLIVPFQTHRKRDRISNRLLDQIRSRLWCRTVGGLMRYEGDVYRGGNPWILTTLWLAIAELGLSNIQEARELFQWVMSKSTVLGMFPEQVHRETGQPFWVIPLGWSHAMYLLFVREVLDRKLESQIWESL
ncbi:MAG: glycoside hydrolase family 15 protein [Bdellovibrionota bacterium]